MSRQIALITLVVRDYDEAIRHYVDVVGFTLVEDTDRGHGKRWVRVRPGNGNGPDLLLAKAANDAQRTAVGNQTGGRVCMFIETDDFWRDYRGMLARGVKFTEQPREENYGVVVVFEDLYGNRFDLIEHRQKETRPSA